MNKYKIRTNDNKYYVVYSESSENAIKKLRDATLAQQENRTIEKYIMAIDGLESETDYNSIKIRISNDQNLSPKSARELLNSLEKQAKKRGIRDSSISDYQPKEISHSRLEAIPLQARQELQNSKNKGATLLSIEGNIEDIINAAEPSNRGALKQMGSKITNDLRRQFRITDNVDRNKIEQVIKSRQFELRKDGEKIQEYVYKGNSEDKKNAFEELAKALPANIGLGLSGDVLSVSFRDESIKDVKLTSEQIIEKAKSLGGQAKQNGATGVLGISITSPQRSDEFANWLEKNNIHYNSDGRQYYVEIQDCEIEDKLIQSGSEEAFKKNIATEIRAGKDPKQAAAIAYSVQRENDNKIKDAYYNIGGYSSENDRMLQQDISKAKLYGLKTYIEKVDGSYQLTVEGPKSKVLKIVKDYFAGDISAIGDSAIKDSISKVENIGKFTLWQDEDTKEYYFDATISRSGKKLHRLNTTDINKAREKVKKELEWVTDSSIKDSSDYAISYRNVDTGYRDKETIKANSAIEAIKKLSDAIKLRGYGTRNIEIISISPNDGHMRLYGSLQALLASIEFRDCNTVVNDVEPNNWTYVMFGTTGEKKVENLTKAEAEHLLKNNKLLGYSGKIYETVRDNDTNNTNKILDSDIVVARSLDELISKIKSWDGETTTNYILSPKSSGWYFDYFITMGHKYSYYAYIKKTAHGRHDNPNVEISKQNIDKTVTAKTAQELIDQVVRILK